PRGRTLRRPFRTPVRASAENRDGSWRKGLAALPRQELARGDDGERDARGQRDQAERVSVPARLRALKNGERERLRSTRDVAGDQNRRTEFAERAAEREKRSGDDAAPSERQRDANERAKGTVAERPCDAEQARVDRLEGRARRTHEEWKRHDR